MQTVAIVGGGFSGVIAAVNLARFGVAPLRVVIVNQGRLLGRGVAYGTTRPEHLLNVAARNMSAFADRPNHFLEWLRTRTEYTDVPDAILRETFIPRRVYGDYLCSLFLFSASPLQDRATINIEVIEDEAVDVCEREPGGGTVLLASGSGIDADKIVLATGNMAPAEIASPAGEPFRHPRYSASPWTDWEKRLPDPHENVMLLGTGLTTVDAFMTLSSLDWQGTIFAISRNGLLPQSHFRGIEYPDFPPADVTTLGLDELVRLVELHCARLRKLGANPAIVVDKLRPHTQRIWQHFTLAEKREFSRRHAFRWNVTRHRIAQVIHQRMATALANGRLQVVKGNILHLEAAGSRVRVAIAEPSGSRLHLDAGYVVNCTGPLTSFTQAAARLYRNLLGKGLVDVDDLDMGLRITPDFAIVGRDGKVSSCLKAFGPLVRGTLWETIAVPELRGQAMHVARKIVEELTGQQRHTDNWPIQSDMEMLEYCI